MIPLPWVPVVGLVIVALHYISRRLDRGRPKLLVAILMLAALVQAFTSLAHALLAPTAAMHACAVALMIALVAAANPALKSIDRPDR